MDNFRALIVLLSIVMVPTVRAAINTIPLDTGGTGRVAAVSGLIAPGGAAGAHGGASVVIDARDRFGTVIRRTKTVGFRAGGVAAWARLCLGSPLICGAAAALTAAAVQQGWQVVQDSIFTPGSQLAVQDGCSTVSIPRPDTGVPTTHHLIPCFPASCFANNKYYDWCIKSTASVSSEFVVGPNGPYWITHNGLTSEGQALVYYSYGMTATAPSPSVVGEPAQEITDEQYESVIWGSPQPENLLQWAPGQWDQTLWAPAPWQGEVYDPATDPLLDPLPQPDPSTDPLVEPTIAADVNVQNWPYPSAPEEPQLSLSDVPSESVDVSNFLSFGTGWLPRTCPSDTVIPLMGESFTISYSLLCDGASHWLHPLLQIIAMMTAIGILIGGLRT